MNTLILAWRNLWRNKRRTIITTSSILFAVFFVVVMRSFQLGSYNNMIKNTIESYMGFLQIQHIDYQDDMTIDNSFEWNEDFISRIQKIEGIDAVVPRIESFALSSTGNQTKGVAVLGIDPESEKHLSNPEGKLVRYRITPEAIEKLKAEKISDEVLNKFITLKGNSYSSQKSLFLDLDIEEEEGEGLIKFFQLFKYPGQTLLNSDSGVLISDRLAKFLRVNPGDTMVLLGQGYQGASAAGIYPIKGVIKIPSPDLDNKLVYMTLEQAQELYNLQGRLTSVSINLKQNSDKSLAKAKVLIASQFQSKEIVIKTWKEFNRVLLQQIQSDSQSGQIMLGLLYFIVFFGIFGTVLMMIHERRREFGILISIGMKRWKLAATTILEMLLMGLMGVLAGIALSLPLLYYGSVYPFRLTGELATMMESFGFEPIMPLEWINTYIMWQGLIVALMVILSCLYPLRKVFKLKEIEALRA